MFDLAADDLRQICATRAIFESGALRIVMTERPENALIELGPIVGRAALALEDGDLATCDELDWQFHEALIAAADNRYLANAYRAISSQLRALRQRMPKESGRIANAIDQHRRILDLCAAGRMDDAIREVSMHVDNVERLLTAIG